MKFLIALAVCACGSSPRPEAPVPADPMQVAFEAATQWNVNQTSGEGRVDEKVQAELRAKAMAQLELACDSKNECACSALKTGRCTCDPITRCAGQPYWFLVE